MQLRRFLVHFAWTIPEIQVNEEKHRVTQLPSFLTYSFYLLYLLTLINFFKPACHGRRCQCFRKPIKLSHCIYVYTDINFFYAYKWDCNGTNGVSHLLLCSPISSYPGDKLIVTNWYFYTPFRILRRIFSVCTRKRSFYSRVLTCNRDIYDGTRSIDAHGSLFTVLRKVQLASEKISFPSSFPPPPPRSTSSQIPTSRIPSIILGYRSVTTTLQICCEFRKCARPADIHTHVPFKRALKI